MADVKIGVNADGSNVSKAINEITDAVNQLAKAVAASRQVKFQPVDVQTAAKDLHTLNKQFEIAVQRSKSLRDALKATNQTGKSIQEIDFQKLSIDPRVAQRMRDKAFGYAARGTAWETEQAPIAPPGAPPPPPPPQKPKAGPNPNNGGGGSGFIARAGRGFTSGIGGGVGQIANQAINGAEAGAESGGLMGGLGGLLKGGLIGGALFGLFKAGQSISEGYGMAKDRDIDLDTLKRQMGDLGVSFVGLKAMSDLAGQGLGINSKELVQLAEQYNQISHTAGITNDHAAESLMDNVRTATGFGRAVGMDPRTSVRFFAGMQQLNPAQNNRELALQIGEAINRSGGRAMADDVMRLVQSFAATTARLSLSTSNTGAYASAFGNMLHGGSPGMTADNAAAILGQANNAISGMGNAGEAGQNFIMGSLNAQGSLNPIAARAQAASGLFGTRGNTFGPDTELNKYLHGYGIDPLQDGTVTDKNKDITNFQSIRANLERQYRDPYLRLDGAQQLFGLSSPEQAAALLNLHPDQFSGLHQAINRAGIKLSDINPGGITTLAAIGGAGSHSELDTVYADIKKRTGNSALTVVERQTLDGAQKGNTEEFRDILLKIMASKEQTETEGSKLRAGIKDLETVQTTIGDKMIGPLNVMRDAMLKLAGVNGKSATPASLRKAAYDAERDDVDAGYNEQIAGIKAEARDQMNDLDAKRATLMNPVTGVPYLRGQKRDVVMKQIADVDAQMKEIKSKRDIEIAAVEKKRAADRAEINAREQQEKDADDKLRKVNTENKETSSDSQSAPLADESVKPTIDTTIFGKGPKQPAPSNSSAQHSQATPGPIGERNNNPFAMRPWRTGQTQAGGFLQFSDMQSGVTAGLKNLLYAQDGHKRNTITDIITPYAPKSDHNNTEKYIDDVAKMTGFAKDKVLNLHDPAVLKSLGKAILQEENAHNSVTDSQIDLGVAAALGNVPDKIAPSTSNASNDNGVRDTLNVNIHVASTSNNAQGSTVQHTMQTSVAVPRGSGVQTVTVH